MTAREKSTCLPNEWGQLASPAWATQEGKQVQELGHSTSAPSELVSTTLCKAQLPRTEYLSVDLACMTLKTSRECGFSVMLQAVLGEAFDRVQSSLGMLREKKNELPYK